MTEVAVRALAAVIAAQAPGGDRVDAAVQAWDEGRLAEAGENARAAIAERSESETAWGADMARLAFMAGVADHADGASSRSHYHFHVARLQHQACGSDFSEDELAMIEEEAVRPGRSFSVDQHMLDSPFLSAPDSPECQPALDPAPVRPGFAQAESPLGVGFANVKWDRRGRVREIAVIWSYPSEVEALSQRMIGQSALTGYQGEGYRVYTFDPCLSVRGNDDEKVDLCFSQ